MNELGNPERREWLRRGLIYTLLGSTFAAFTGILADVWRAAGRFSSARWTDIAPLAAIAAEGTFPFPEQQIAVIREGNRIAGISLKCTHLGCLVNTMDQGFFCPCHGSEFGPRGEVYSGPAKVNLPWHVVRVERGRVWIHTGEKQPGPMWIEVTSALAPRTS
jgi:Rieske Fe-S protein